MVILPLRKLGFAILPSRKWDSPVCHSQTIHTRKYALWRICCQIIIFFAAASFSSRFAPEPYPFVPFHSPYLHGRESTERTGERRDEDEQRELLHRRRCRRRPTAAHLLGPFLPSHGLRARPPPRPRQAAAVAPTRPRQDAAAAPTPDMGEASSSSSFIPTAALSLYPPGPSGIPLIPCPECGDKVVECKSWKNNGKIFFKCVNYDEFVSI